MTPRITWPLWDSVTLRDPSSRRRSCSDDDSSTVNVRLDFGVALILRAPRDVRMWAWCEPIRVSRNGGASNESPTRGRAGTSDCHSALVIHKKSWRSDRRWNSPAASLARARRYCLRMRPSAGGLARALPFQELGNSSMLAVRFSGGSCLNFSRAARSRFGAKGLLVPSGPPMSPLLRGGATTAPRAVKTAPNPQPFAASGTNSLLISFTVASSIFVNVQTCTATHRFQPYPQGTPTMPGPYAITGLPSLPALTAASQGSRSQAILAMFVAYSPGCGLMSWRNLASFASVCAISAETAGFDFAPVTATGLADFGTSGCCANNPPPVTATIVTRTVALVLNLVFHM